VIELAETTDWNLLSSNLKLPIVIEAVYDRYIMTKSIQARIFSSSLWMNATLLFHGDTQKF
jgi:hypothetical protein